MYRTPANRTVEIVEVGPRDGFQNEDGIVATADKIEPVRRMAVAGVQRIEVASFVNPARVPQMAEAVAAGLPDDGATYIGLVLNRQGAVRALATKVHQLGAVCTRSSA